MEIEGVEYKYYIDSFSDVIHSGFEQGDIRLLRGIQTFDVSTYSHLEGIESILSVLFALTTDGKIEANDLEHRLKVDKDRYTQLGILERMEKRLKRKKDGEIPFFFIRNACSGLKNVIKNIFLLKEEGYIEVIGDGLDNSHLKLSSIWDNFIQNTIMVGYESNIFGSSISRMIASSIFKRGFRILKPIISVLFLAEKNGGEVFINIFKQLFEQHGLEYRHFSNCIERDQKKPKDIKLIHYMDKRRVIFNTASIYTAKKWLVLAEELQLRDEQKLSGNDD